MSFHTENFQNEDGIRVIAKILLEITRQVGGYYEICCNTAFHLADHSMDEILI